MNRYRAELLAHTKASVGECPLADGVDHLIWLDIRQQTIWRTELGSGRSTRHDRHDHVSAIGHCRSGGYITAGNRSFARLRSLGDSETVITTVGADPNIRFNDGKVDPWGRFVAGTAVIGSTPELGGLYMLDNAGGTARLLSCVTISNGLDWAPDRRSFYYVDTPKQRIDRFNVDPDTGQLLDREVFASIDQRLGLPDGLAVDSEGCLWLAVWGSGAVIGFDPDGREIARIDVPVSCPTSCTFGDSDGKTLFITTARASDDDGSPLAGAVFAVRMTVSGQPVRCFG